VISFILQSKELWLTRENYEMVSGKRRRRQKKVIEKNFFDLSASKLFVLS
jgi:hypothetical protein